MYVYMCIYLNIFGWAQFNFSPNLNSKPNPNASPNANHMPAPPKQA